MQKKNIFFDLDGTLVNTREGIFNSVKYVISAFNLPEPELQMLRKFIGPPLHYSFKKLFNLDDSYADKCVNKYREYYKEKGIYECELYKGIKDTLEILSKSYKLFITTSKPTPFAKKVAAKLGIEEYFTEIFGPPVDSPSYSKSDVIENAVSAFSLKKAECVLIGDTAFDGEGAQNSGIDFIGVTYGFGTTEELKKYNPLALSDTPADIIHKL